MSFKQDRTKLKIIENKNQTIKPKQGCITIVWWKKGNKADDFYYKAEVYGLDGIIISQTYIDGHYDNLIKQIKNDLNLK